MSPYAFEIAIRDSEWSANVSATSYLHACTLPHTVLYVEQTPAYRSVRFHPSSYDMKFSKFAYIAGGDVLEFVQTSITIC